MTLRDKLEIGSRADAVYRRDNLPDREIEGPEVPAGPGRSPIVVSAAKRDLAKPQHPVNPPAQDARTARATPRARRDQDRSDRSDRTGRKDR